MTRFPKDMNAPQKGSAANSLNPQEKMALKIKASAVFRPGTPIDKQALFAGRQSQINDVINAVLQRGRHVILFGERGVGKTSLAKVTCEILAEHGYKLVDCHTVNCDSKDTFNSLWRNVFREMSMTIKGSAATGFSASTSTSATQTITLDQLLPTSRKLTPDDIRYILTKLGQRCIIVLDEIDRMQDPRDRALLADTIKTLADHAVDATLILIGVADSVEELISSHQSIERSLAQVPMQRMHESEMSEILSTGFDGSPMSADSVAKRWIVLLSQGLPHYAHSLGLYSALTAIDAGKTHVTVGEVLAATAALVDKSHSIRTAYFKAINSPQKNNLYAQVLRAAALAKTDELGYFRASAVKEPLTMIMERPYDVPYFSRHLIEFASTERGPILTMKGEPRKRLFRFLDPLMQPFVIIHDYSVGMLTNQALVDLNGRLEATEQSSLEPPPT